MASPHATGAVSPPSSGTGPVAAYPPGFAPYLRGGVVELPGVLQTRTEGGVLLLRGPPPELAGAPHRKTSKDVVSLCFRAWVRVRRALAHLHGPHPSLSVCRFLFLNRIANKI
jgi:hypothetical protein